MNYGFIQQTLISIFFYWQFNANNLIEFISFDCFFFQKFRHNFFQNISCQYKMVHYPHFPIPLVLLHVVEL